MNFNESIKCARVLLTDKDNAEYLRGICEFIAVAFPGPNFEDHCDTAQRALEIEACIFTVQFQSGQRVMFNSTEAGGVQDVYATIDRPLDSTEADLDDVGPIYKIKLDDDTIIDAFADELILTN